MIRWLLPSAALLSLLVGGLALAQTAPRNIAQAERESAEAARRSQLLRQEADKADSEAERTHARSEALVADIEKIEADITLAQTRVSLAEAQKAARRARLADRQQPVMQLTSALQTMARRPPALALVQPGSIDEIVRVRALLASTLPAVRERTAALRADLAAAERLKAMEARSAAALAASRDALRRKRSDLALLEAKERQRSQNLAGAALLETDRALAFSEEARSMTEQMRTDSRRAKVRRALAVLPAPLPRPTDQPAGANPLRSPFYQLPVAGELIRGTGELSDAGIHARGLTFRTTDGAPVVAPRGGQVVYAGRFRSYGEIVIIDHGGDWTSTITNLATLRVRQGDRVKTGDPIGRARRQLTVELRQGGQPMAISALIGPAGR